MVKNVIYKNELKKLELAETIWKIYIMENGDYIAINVCVCIYIYISEVERVQKYSTQVKVPLHYWNFT